MMPVIWLSSRAVHGRRGGAKVRRDSFGGHVAVENCSMEVCGVFELFVYLGEGPLSTVNSAASCIADDISLQMSKHPCHSNDT